MPSIVVLGARNLGGAILSHHLQAGWKGAAVARSAETLETVRAAGGLALEADASDPASLQAALERARADFGSIDVIVNAVSAARPTKPGPFGGGTLSEATVEDFRGWTGAVAEQAFVFLSEGVRVGAKTLIQVTGGSARRAMAGRGLWAAGAHATRALVHAAAQELREDGVHVALLIVDATIDSPKTASMIAGKAENETADQAQIARAVEYLAGQTARAWTHELTVTPAGDRWLP
ncbi:SDR family NAD(P)-dependent oxidoreductase [Solirubrobacter taibaiensis]|nr:SDR family NAD(P)-dependent oxidoreductase [Solirubrobacter taibaiensis]